MRRRKKSLGFAEMAMVHHVNSATFEEMGEAVLSCAKGQIAFRRQTPAAEADAFLDDIQVWTHRALFHKPVARRLFADILRCLFHDLGRSGYLSKSFRGCRSLVFFGRGALSGLGWRRMAARLRLAGFKTLFYLPGASPDRRYRLFRKVWEGLFDLGFMQAMAQSPGSFGLSGGPRLDYPAAQIPQHRLAGFHPVADDQGRPCRWTYPAALIRLTLPAADYQVRLALRSPLPRPQWCLRLFFNGRTIPEEAIVEEGNTSVLAFPVWAGDFLPGDEQTLTLTCRPCPPSPVIPEGQSDSGLIFLGLRFDPKSGAAR